MFFFYLTLPTHPSESFICAVGNFKREPLSFKVHVFLSLSSYEFKSQSLTSIIIMPWFFRMTKTSGKPPSQCDWKKFQILRSSCRDIFSRSTTKIVRLRSATISFELYSTVREKILPLSAPLKKNIVDNSLILKPVFGWKKSVKNIGKRRQIMYNA